MSQGEERQAEQRSAAGDDSRRRGKTPRLKFNPPRAKSVLEKLHGQDRALAEQVFEAVERDPMSHATGHLVGQAVDAVLSGAWDEVTLREFRAAVGTSTGTAYACRDVFHVWPEGVDGLVDIDFWTLVQIARLKKLKDPKAIRKARDQVVREVLTKGLSERDTEKLVNRRRENSPVHLTDPELRAS